jgi:hypothetical protein
MQNNLYTLIVKEEFSTSWADWKSLKIISDVPVCLVNYGFGITPKDVLVIYGGVLGNGLQEKAMNGRKARHLRINENLYLFNFSR